MMTFDRDILKAIEALFEPDSIRTEVYRSESGERSSAVRLTHLPTDLQLICETYDTQIQNKAMGLLLLKLKLEGKNID